MEGCEVKSIREGKMNLSDSYARFIDDELYLMGCHITPFFAATHRIPDPLRDRKLLLHRSELKKLIRKSVEKKLSIIPLSAYFSKNRVKIQLGVGQPKKLHDKRQSLKERTIKREMDQNHSHRH